MLKHQIGKIRAYKVVDAHYEGIYRGGIKYNVGKTVSDKNADCNTSVQCGSGISLATLDWCMRNWATGGHIMLCEFTAKDIAAIPTATDGKFRVHRCKVIREIDLKEIGLIK